MTTYVCTVCGYEHQQDGELPDDWTCPVCGASKALFKQKEKTGEAIGHSTNLIPNETNEASDMHRNEPKPAKIRNTALARVAGCCKKK